VKKRTFYFCNASVGKDDLENVGLAFGITSISLFYGKLQLLPV